MSTLSLAGKKPSMFDELLEHARLHGKVIETYLANGPKLEGHVLSWDAHSVAIARPEGVSIFQRTHLTSINLKRRHDTEEYFNVEFKPMSLGSGA